MKKGKAMQFLVVFRRLAENLSKAQLTHMLELEAEMVRTLYSEGFIRQIWHRDDGPGAVLVIETTDQAMLNAGLARLPMYQAGMLEAEKTLALSPYRGFGPRRA